MSNNEDVKMIGMYLHLTAEEIEVIKKHGFNTTSATGKEYLILNHIYDKIVKEPGNSI